MGNSLVQSVISQLNNSAEEKRQESQEKRLSMYLDSYSDEIDTLLKKQFHRDNYKRLYPMIANYYNLLKKIVDLKAILYKRESVRQWYKRDNKKIDAGYAELILNSNIHSVMQLCNKLTEINNTSLVRIIPNPDKNIIKYEAIPSELISITQDPENPSKIKSLIHKVCVHDSYNKLGNLIGRASNSNERATYVSKYFYWDDEVYIILDADMKKVSELPNPYKIIPYVLFSNLPSISGSVWNETVNTDLYDGTLQVNVIQTYLNNALKLTGYRQPYITGMSADETKKLDERASDGLQPIVITDPNASIGSIELSSNIKDINDILHDIIAHITDNHGVSFNSMTNSAQKQSGLAISIEKEQMENLREMQQPLYRNAERELAEKTVIIANNDLKYNIDIEGRFSINFYQEEEDIAAQDLIALNQFYIKTNIKSVADIYMENDPDCPDIQTAIKRLAENKRINDEYRNEFSLISVNDSQTQDDEESEETE